MPLGAFQRPSASLRTDSVAGPASDRHAADDQSWPIPVGEPAGRYLHERIGPKKRAENYAGGRRYCEIRRRAAAARIAPESGLPRRVSLLVVKSVDEFAAPQP